MKPNFKTWVAAAVFSAMGAVAAPAATFSFSSILDGQQANPGPTSGTPSAATGRARMVLDDVAETLNFSLSVSGIALSDLMDIGPFGPVHIHRAPRGQNGPVTVAFLETVFDGDSDDTNDVPTGLYTATSTGFDIIALVRFAGLQDQNGETVEFGRFLATANQGGYYLNVHTAAVASGEIRGQLSAVPLPASALLLFGSLAGLGAFGARRKRAA